MRLITAAIAFAVFSAANALYSPRDGVVQVDDSSFAKEVTKDPGVVAVEFYAPWCGHCKNLAPEWKKAAKLLKGVAKVVALDASSQSTVAARYGVQGFPTIKIFGADKRKPVDYQGQRTATAIVDSVMKEVSALIAKRTGRRSKSSSSSSSGGGNRRGSADASQPGGGKHVARLTSSDFDAKVLGSDEPWMVEFYAPWCGHCKSLAPEWATAAEMAEGDVRFAAVDATEEQSVAQRFGIKGFPTIKFFPAGAVSDGEAVDYNGQRDASSIAQWAQQRARASSAAGKVEELLEQDAWDKACKGKRICVVAFLPHITTEGKALREKRIADLTAAAKAAKSPMFRFFWTGEADQQPMEVAFGVQASLPAVVAVSKSKKAFAVQRGRFDSEGLASFLKGLQSGRVKPVRAKDGLPPVRSVEPWDGQDAPEEEDDDLDLEAILGEEL